jgi:type III pantothenate kinase
LNLLIDSGNSLIKWALEKDGVFIKEGGCLTSYASSLHDLWEDYDNPARVIVANVAGEMLAGEIRKAAYVRWQLDAEFITSTQNCCGLTNSYHNPEQLGIDRWMAMLAAFQMIDGPVIVVDCGTAVTIDLVKRDGLFAGGVIMPGLMAALRSLEISTDAIVQINSFNSDVGSIAQSTEDGVVAGVLLCLAGGIERVVREQTLLSDEMPTVLITGGDGEKLVPYLTISTKLQSGLVLQGLRVFAETE